MPPAPSCSANSFENANVIAAFPDGRPQPLIPIGKPQFLFQKWISESQFLNGYELATTSLMWLSFTPIPEFFRTFAPEPQPRCRQWTSYTRTPNRRSARVQSPPGQEQQHTLAVKPLAGERHLHRAPDPLAARTNEVVCLWRHDWVIHLPIATRRNLVRFTSQRKIGGQADHP